MGALVLALYMLAGSYVREINSFLGEQSTEVETPKSDTTDTTYYKSSYSSIDDMLSAKLKLCEDATDEGIVMLKNDGALPLRGVKNITCLGRGSTDLVYGGASGAGIIGNVGTSINKTLKEGLESAGYSVNPTMWDFYSKSDYSRNSGGARGRETYRLGEVPVSEYPKDRDYAKYHDACLVVLTRNSGESNEAPIGDFEDGTSYYQLTDAEKDVIKEAEGNFDTVIVLVNSPSALSIDELERDDGVDAIIQAGGLGARGANSVGKILAGKVNPSGHTSDTYAVSSLSSPALQNHGDFTYANADELLKASSNGTAEHNTKYLVQAEGIYTGYKYYETRYVDCVMGQGNASGKAGTYASTNGWNYSQEVSYPFGYGLSYTKFDQELTSFDVTDDVIHATVRVTNTGDASGKDAVQLYVQTPYTDYDRANGVEKAGIQLVDFGKTKLLKPGESQDIKLSMDLYSICSYDSNAAKTWILDAGDYWFAIGENAHDALNNVLAAQGYTTADGMDAKGDASKTAAWKLDRLRTFSNPTFSDKGFTTYAGTHHMNGGTITNQMDKADLNTYEPGTVKYLTRSDWEGSWPTPVKNVSANDAMKKLLLHQEYKAGEADDSIITGAKGDLKLISMRGKAYDDPAWDKLLNQMTLDEMTSLVGKDFSGTEPVKSLGYAGTIENDGPSGAVTNYASRYDDGDTIFEGVSSYSSVNPRMYPSESLVACAFNQRLVYDLGVMMGEDAFYTDQSSTWAPGINLHRSPYSGRNFEYFSEDSQATYILGAQQVAGMQSNGLVACPKHFCFNDYETNRFGLSTFMNEQTARENGLRAYEGSIAVGHAHNVMTTLARVGCTWMGLTPELQNNILRGEWGFDGYVVSDNAIMPYMYGDSITCGTDKFAVFIPGRYEKQLSAERLTSDGKLLRSVREACHRILYVNVNSLAMNGVSESSTIADVMPGWQRAILTVDCALLGLTALFSILYLRSRNKFKGLVEKAGDAPAAQVSSARARHGAGFVLGVVALALTCVSFGSYLLSANDSYGYDAVLILLYAATIATSAIALFKDSSGLGPVASALLTGFTQGMIMNRRCIYFMTGLLGISQEGIDMGMILAFVLLAPAVLLNLASALGVRGRKEGANRAYAA